MDNIKNNQRLAQSASALGAGILGFAIGAMWGAAISYTMLIIALILGAIIHVAGMYVMQMKDPDKTGSIAKLLWISAWVCLLALIGIFIYLQLK